MKALWWVIYVCVCVFKLSINCTTVREKQGMRGKEEQAEMQWLNNRASILSDN